MPTPGKSNVIPGMRYQDAPAAIGWLCRVLGFSRNLVVPGEGGIILHAQLTLGDGMIMLGSERDDAHGRLMAAPGPERANTQSAYLVVDDPAAVHDRAVAAGAEIVTPLHDPEYGGTFFACRDPEGHVWNVGSYDPWKAPARPACGAPPDTPVLEPPSTFCTSTAATILPTAVLHCVP